MQSLTRRELLKLLALLPAVGIPGPAPRRRASPRPQGQLPPNILILVFDALSAEHVQLYGYRRSTTPNLARFAERAVVFHSHYSAGSFTTSGTASLLTGSYPWSHRAINLQGTALDEFTDRRTCSGCSASRGTIGSPILTTLSSRPCWINSDPTSTISP